METSNGLDDTGDIIMDNIFARNFMAIKYMTANGMSSDYKYSSKLDDRGRLLRLIVTLMVLEIL